MRRLLFLAMIIVILTGCANNGDELNRPLAVRQKILNSNGIEFVAVITADYGSELYIFKMQCEMDQSGNMTFSVLEPDTICGISGNVSSLGGALTFDDKVLAFPLFADGQITPISAAWVALNTLRSGYISACGIDGDMYRIQLDDSYAENALHVDFWTDQNNTPVRAEILWKGRRIVSLMINDLTFM